jgi:hypothetical protein
MAQGRRGGQRLTALFCVQCQRPAPKTDWRGDNALDVIYNPATKRRKPGRENVRAFFVYFFPSERRGQETGAGSPGGTTQGVRIGVEPRIIFYSGLFNMEISTFTYGGEEWQRARSAGLMISLKGIAAAIRLIQ